MLGRYPVLLHGRYPVLLRRDAGPSRLCCGGACHHFTAIRNTGESSVCATRIMFLDAGNPGCDSGQTEGPLCGEVLCCMLRRNPPHATGSVLELALLEECLYFCAMEGNADSLLWKHCLTAWHGALRCPGGYLAALCPLSFFFRTCTRSKAWGVEQHSQ